MEFKVSELEREPIDFDLELAPGAVDLGEEAEQIGKLATSGHAEVLHEHRGPRDIVADIRLRGQFDGKFQVPLPTPNLCTAAAGIYNGNAISPTNCPAGFSNHAVSNPAWNYGDNYIWQANEIHPRRNDTVRFDWNLNEKNRVFVRYRSEEHT